MRYEWDEAKRQANLEKHGVDFAEAEKFNWDEAIIEPDDRRDHGEQRLRALGPISGRLYAMACVHRGDAIRIISLRKANRREFNYYVQEIQIDSTD